METVRPVLYEEEISEFFRGQNVEAHGDDSAGFVAGFYSSSLFEDRTWRLMETVRRVPWGHIRLDF
jgi:hypothetical protein